MHRCYLFCATNVLMYLYTWTFNNFCIYYLMLSKKWEEVGRPLDLEGRKKLLKVPKILILWKKY